MQTTKKAKKRKAPALNREILRRVKRDTDLVAKIITATGKSYPTVMRWLKDNDPLLTQAKCLQIICIELNMTQEEVLFKVA